jgi:hypothetical protein
MENDLKVFFFLNLVFNGFSPFLFQWEDRMQRGLFRYDVTACETKV